MSADYICDHEIYTNKFGHILWTEPRLCSRLFGSGEFIVKNGQRLVVLRTAVLGEMIIINLDTTDTELKKIV